MSSKIFNKSLLKNKKIIVVGGSSGIGKSFSVQASKIGAEIILVARSKEKLLEVKKNLSFENGQNHKIYSKDLSDFSKCQKIFERIREEEKLIDAVVWCAGEEIIKQTRSINEDDIKKVFGASNIGFFGALKIFCSKRFWSKSGSLIMLSSVSSYKGNPGMVLYSASKSSVLGMVKPLALELSQFNVRVNALVLGAVNTSMNERVTSKMNSEMIEEFKNSHLFGFGEPLDISNVIIFLLSDAAKWITGSEILVDGGYLVR